MCVSESCHDARVTETAWLHVLVGLVTVQVVSFAARVGVLLVPFVPFSSRMSVNPSLLHSAEAKTLWVNNSCS